MKHIAFISLLMMILVTGCMQEVDLDVDVVPDKPHIKSVKLAYMDTTGLITGNINHENIVDVDNLIDSVIVKDRTVDFTNIWAQVTLESGCNIEPLDGAPEFGEYGDFSQPVKYRVTAPSGATADWTVVVDYYVPKIGCLTDFWDGALNCTDDIYPGYSPSSCTGVKVGDECNMVNISFDFWADSGAPVTLELELGEIDFETMQGSVTLLNDVQFTSWGSDMTFHAGDAGIYNASSGELKLALAFSGYGDITTYTFTIGK